MKQKLPAKLDCGDNFNPLSFHMLNLTITEGTTNVHQLPHSSLPLHSDLGGG